MSTLRREIGANFAAFDAAWPKDQTSARLSLTAAIKIYESSFVRISSIQAWRVSLVSSTFSEGAQGFFFEAQNDFLTSHFLARSGSFRQALKALRSAMENVLFALYYNDHRIELLQWETGKHRLGFSDLFKYFESHPFLQYPTALNSLTEVKSEYATLSKAVHGSAVAFRMTKNLSDINLWSDDIASAGMWSARESSAIANVNIILTYLLSEHLKGASQRSLRQAAGLVMSKGKRGSIKNDLSVTILAH